MIQTSAVDATNSPWSVRIDGHVLFRDGSHSRVAGSVGNMVSQPVMPLTDLAPIA